MFKHETISRSKAQQGTAMIETMLAMGIFISIIAVIFTIAIAAFRYSILTDTTAFVLQRASKNPISILSSSSAPNPTCSDLPAEIEKTAREYINSTYGFDGNDEAIEFDVTVNSGGITPECRASVTVISSWEFPCFFCNHFEIPHSLIVSQSRDVEESIFRRCGTCEECWNPPAPPEEEEGV